MFRREALITFAPRERELKPRMPDKTDRVHVHIGIDMRGNVTLVFPMPTDRLRLPPADMRQIAALLVAKCDEAERKDRVDEEDD